MRRLVILALAACSGDLDPPWQLDHDRIIAVRATPPAIVAGARSEIDGFLAVKGSATVQQPPEAVLVISPESLASVVTLDLDSGKWVVTAPGEAQLAAARVELALGPTDPVPLQLGVSYAGQTLVAVKTLRLGVAADNPVLGQPSMNGTPIADDADLVVGTLVDVPLSLTVADTDGVMWLTSCGTLHDHDEPQARLQVEKDDPTMGEFAVVLRDDAGGVAWRVWKIHAE